jgi:hypothetical protein
MSHSQEYQSPCLLSIRKYLREHPRSSVLDLGNFNNSKLQYLSVSQCKIDALGLCLDNKYGLDCISKAGMYDLVLCWDLLNYLSEEGLLQFFAYLDKHTKKNAFLYFFTRNQAMMPTTPCDFQLSLPNKLHISTFNDEEVECPRYSSLFIKERLLMFYNQRAFLLKNGLQENIWAKSPDPPL